MTLKLYFGKWVQFQDFSITFTKFLELYQLYVVKLFFIF